MQSVDAGCDSTTMEIEVFGVRGVLQSHRGPTPAVLETHGYRRDDNGLVPVDEHRVYELIGERKAAKAIKDFAAADRAREALRAMAVDVFDSSRIWRVRGGTREFNAGLLQLAHSKQLSKCRAAFEAGASLTDDYSHAIVIDAHAACGDAQGARAALVAMRAAGYSPGPSEYAAALGAGDLPTARQLLGEAERELGGSSGDGSGQTKRLGLLANAFLRVCVAGGGVDDAVALVHRLGRGAWAAAASPEASTFEYVGLLCAQALQLDDACAFAARALGAACRGRPSAHAAARVHVAAARGAALAGDWARCKAEVATARELLARADDEGGGGGGGGGGDERRGARVFRQHQKEEAENELLDLERMAAAAPPAALPLLLRRLLPLPLPADTADAAATVEAELESACGLRAWRARLEQSSEGAGEAEAAAVRASLGRVLGSRAGGPLDFAALFEETATPRPRKGGEAKRSKREAKEGGASSSAPSEYWLELGCGGGEWVAAQAEAAPSGVRWLALELRRDRAHATAARLALAGRRNAATLSAAAADALERWVPPGSIARLFCNHPEPPQQHAVGGGAAFKQQQQQQQQPQPEAAHMLDTRLFDAAAAALRPGGTFTIVTDNAWFADLLLDSLAAHGAWAAVPGALEAATAAAAAAQGGASRTLRRSAGGLQLIAAPPGEWCGHVVSSSSYFDRLWRRGASPHCAVAERYVLHCVLR